MKFFEKIKKIKIFSIKIDENDKSSILKLFSSLSVGAMLNFALFCMFKTPFTWYTWIGYGFVIHLIENKLIKWIRSIIFSK